MYFSLIVDQLSFFFLETGVLHSKPVYKKENGVSDHVGSSSGQSGNHSYYQFPSHRLNVLSLRFTCLW